ncbi:MAG TPA: SIMPL domain-containing protein [Chakrabartia sp.]|nr:SIMPL domain-containing protein [Chakrabartia sp.]
MKSLFAAALAASTLILPTMVEAQEIAPRTISGTRLDLQARGESRVTPDMAVISAGVVTQSTDAGTAMRENAARMTRVLTALKAAGIADKDIQTQSISLSPQYRYANNETPVITGYQANNTLTVRFRDIGKSGAVLDALVKQGANQINGPTLTVENPEAAQDAARLSAIKTLRARAELYAKAAGLKVGRILQLSESVDYNPGPMPMMARMATADGGAEKTSISAGEQGIGVTVNAVFELQ